MKKHLLTTTAATAAMALSGAAHADNYVTIFGGYSMADDHSVNLATGSGAFSASNSTVISSTLKSHIHTIITSSTHFWSSQKVFFSNTSGTWNTSVDLDMSMDSGFVIGAAAGRNFGEGLNFELEIAYRKHNADAVASYNLNSAWSGTAFTVLFTAGGGWIHYTNSSTAPFPGSFYTAPTGALGTGSPVIATYGTTAISGGTNFSSTEMLSGDMRAFSVMANVWFEFGGTTGNWHPYIGGGVGWADVEIDLGEVGSPSDSGLAYQAGVGVGWDLPNSNSRINLEYRYFAVNDLDFVSGPFDLGYDYQVSEILVGYKFRF